MEEGNKSHKSSNSKRNLILKEQSGPFQCHDEQACFVVSYISIFLTEGTP